MKQWIQRGLRLSHRCHSVHTLPSRTFCSSTQISLRQSFEKNSKETTKKKTGLKGWYEPKDLLHAAKECVEDAESLLKSTSKRTGKGIIEGFDDLSRRVCEVADPAEFIRQAHPQKEWRKAAEESWGYLNSFLAHLNALPSIPPLLSAALDSGLQGEDWRVGWHLREEIISGGVLLPPPQRTQLLQLQQEMAVTAQQFFQLSSSPHLSGNSQDISPGSPEAAEILRKGPSEDRKRMYHNNYSSSPPLQSLLSSLLHLRREVALLSGFPSYSTLTLSRHSVAGTPQKVEEFLEELSQKIRPLADQELSLLRSAKKLEEGTDTIYPWDLEYYMHKVRQTQFPLDENYLHEFFTLPNCMEGLDLVTQSLFGVTMEPTLPDEGELWHPSIRKVTLKKDGKPLGIIYFDLFPRENKFSGAATFTLGLGITRYPDILPRVVLLGNFAHPGKHSFLSFQGIETLFHEFGHCLSAVLARTAYQHLGGTRAALDFVETPSTLWENFPRDPRVLPRFATHFRNGEVLSPSIVETIRDRENLFSALEVQRQLCYAVLDHSLHSLPPPSSFSSLWGEILSRHHSVPMGHEGLDMGAFSHLATYGGGYYSYLFCRVFSSSVWQECFAADPLNRSQGMKLWREMFQWGGARDPKDILAALVGPNVSIDHFIQHLKSVK